MCGIAGLFDIEGRRQDSNPAMTALAMADALSHRGPDGRNCWGDREAGIGLGHRRLAIIDLSPTGAQPMTSADERYVITYNGEVYNFPELRDELMALGYQFRGTSDTEVMLAAILEWGVESAINRFVGMFAFAVFDRTKRILHLVRDRLGVKPLYWTIADGTLLFGSQLRALMAHPSFRGDVDPAAVDAVLRYSYVPTPHTIFRNVWKLPPGAILSIDARGKPSITLYWQLRNVVGQDASRSVDAHEALNRLEGLIREAVRQRMISDVPLGAFLSGGIDSSAVVAFMQASTERPVKTYTVGFSDDAYDETRFAREIADHLGTDHTEITLKASESLDLVTSVADWFDEPFGDSSQLPTYLVSRMTRQHVTVALSGDGGDELFGGYPKYAWLDQIWRRTAPLPRSWRAALGRLPTALPQSALQSLAAGVLDAGRRGRLGEKTRRLAAALSADGADDAAIALATVGIDDGSLVNHLHDRLSLAPIPETNGRPADLISRMQAHDMATYLPDDILTKVDRCSMAVSLETREPLLDHHLVEYIWSLPPAIRRGNGKPKALLRQILERHLPAAMIDRPKRGFSVPLDAWLHGPWRDWAEDLLAPRRVADDGLLNPEHVRRLWQRHLSGEEENATALWNILMVRAWSERWLRSPKITPAAAKQVQISA